MWPIQSHPLSKPQLLPQLMDYASRRAGGGGIWVASDSPTDRPTSDDSGLAFRSHSRTCAGRGPGSKSGAAKMRALETDLLRRTAGAAKQFCQDWGTDSGID